jgi:predicted secreted protein
VIEILGIAMTRLGRSAGVAAGRLCVGSIGVGLLLAFSAPAFAQTLPAPTVLHLTQTAESKVVRDLLRVELRVEAEGADALSVQTAINRRMAAALDRTHRVIGVAVETGSYTVGEEEPTHHPPRWRGSQSLVLRGTATDAILELAGVLQSQGLLMSSMVFEVSPETVRGAEQDLTAAALAGLGARAAAIAGRLRLEVLGYRDLKIGNAETGPPPMPRFAAAMAMPAPVASPGEAVIRLEIAAEVLLGAPAAKTNQ